MKVEYRGVSPRTKHEIDVDIKNSHDARQKIPKAHILIDLASGVDFGRILVCSAKDAIKVDKTSTK